MESEVEASLIFIKDINPKESPSKNLEEGGPISPLEVEIPDYFRIEKEKWEIFLLNSIVLPFMTLTRKMRLRPVLPFSWAFFMRTIAADPAKIHNAEPSC